MTSHQILNFADHGALRVRADAAPELGDGVMSCLVVPAEFRRLAAEYPILFRYDGESRSFSALALFGFEPGENLFLQDGNWDAASRPFAMAVQPCLVGRPRDGQGPGQVHIDMAHPRVTQADNDGVRLFDDAGQPSPWLEEIAGMLGALDEGYRASGEFYAALERHDLLEPFSMDVTLDNGASHRLVGYHLINEEKLQALDAAALGELHAAGHLEPVYMALASLGNLGKLVRRKNRKTDG